MEDPPPHQKISGLKSLGLGSFFVPDQRSRNLVHGKLEGRNWRHPYLMLGHSGTQRMPSQTSEGDTRQFRTPTPTPPKFTTSLSCAWSLRTSGFWGFFSYGRGCMVLPLACHGTPSVGRDSVLSCATSHVRLNSVQQMVSGESAGECLQTGFERRGLPPQRAPLGTVYPLREHLNSVQRMVSGGCCEGLFPDTVCWTRFRNTWTSSCRAMLSRGARHDACAACPVCTRDQEAHRFGREHSH